MKLRWSLLTLCCVCSGGHAKLQVTPDLSLQELYTSNIELAPANTAQSEWVTEVAPMIIVDNKSPRSPVYGYYRAQGLHYAHSQRQDKIYHQGYLNAGKNLWGDRLKFDVIGDHSQTVLFPSNQITLDNIRGGETTNLSRILLGPEVNHHLGKRLNSRLRYQFGHVIFHQDVPNAITHDADLDISTRYTTHWTFNSKVHWDTTRQDGRRLDETFDGIATVGYYVTRHLRPYAAFGYEDHKNQPGFSSLDGSRWHVGLVYTPTKRLLLDGYYGRRAFGNTYYARASWFKKHASLSASYEEEVTNFFRAQLMMLPVLEVNTLGLTSIQFQPQVREDVFVRKVFSLTFNSLTYKSLFFLQPYYEIRELDSTQNEERALGLNGNFTWIKHPRLQASAFGGFAHQKLINRVTDERYQAGIRVDQQIGTKTQLSYGYSHFKLDRTFDANRHENTVSFKVLYQLK